MSARAAPATHHVLILGDVPARTLAIVEAVAARHHARALDSGMYRPKEGRVALRAGAPLEALSRARWISRVAQEVLRVGLIGRKPVICGFGALTRAERDVLRGLLPGVSIIRLAYAPETRAAQPKDMQAAAHPEDVLDCDPAQSEAAILDQISAYLAGGDGRAPVNPPA
ncbi:hypothetical protein FGG78_17055 [Thioclava sp. BHET1]|nr:hypothetical protein FGG78_17055 [Thioclava sp. BHET1]